MTTSKKRSDRFLQILGVAQGRFARQGFDGTTLAQIATDSGIRKASLYYHFPTKESLYLAVIGAILDDLRSVIRKAARARGDYVERLDNLGGSVVDYLGTHPDAASLLVREAMGEGLFLFGEGRDAAEATLRETAAFLEAGMAAGAFAHQDPRQLALSIIGAHLFYFAAPKLSGLLVGGNVFRKKSVAERRRALISHVRSVVCLP